MSQADRLGSALAPGTNGWNTAAPLVLQELKRLGDGQEAIRETLTTLSADVAVLKDARESETTGTTNRIGASQAKAMWVAVLVSVLSLVLSVLFSTHHVHLGL